MPQTSPSTHPGTKSQEPLTLERAWGFKAAMSVDAGGYVLTQVMAG